MRSLKLLRGPEAAELYARLKDRSVQELETCDRTKGQVRPGLPMVPDDELDGILRALLDAARTQGYPDSAPDDKIGFDRSASELLHRGLRLSLNAAARDETWLWMGLVFAPSLVKWRWGASEDRWYRAPRRLMFRALWLRAEVLNDPANGADPYHFLRDLNTDELAQIVERPELAADRRLARETARGFVDLRTSVTGGVLMPDGTRAPLDAARRIAYRELAKRVYRLSQTAVTEAVTDADLRHEVSLLVPHAAAEAANPRTLSRTELIPDDPEDR